MADNIPLIVPDNEAATPVVVDNARVEVPSTPLNQPLINANPRPEGQSKAESFFRKHWGKILYAVLVIVVVIIIIVCASKKSEHLEDVFYLDQMAMQNSDPTFFKYTGRERDVLGESSRDYFLQNRMFSNSGVAPQHLEDDSAFVNQTDYLDMPPQYRPETPAVLYGQGIGAESTESAEAFVGGLNLM